MLAAAVWPSPATGKKCTSPVVSGTPSKVTRPDTSAERGPQPAAVRSRAAPRNPKNRRMVAHFPLVTADDVARVHGGQRLPDAQRDAVADELHRAVAQADVDAAGVPAARGDLLADGAVLHAAGQRRVLAG